MPGLSWLPWLSWLSWLSWHPRLSWHPGLSWLSWLPWLSWLSWLSRLSWRPRRSRPSHLPEICVIDPNIHRYPPNLVVILLICHDSPLVCFQLRQRFLEPLLYLQRPAVGQLQFNIVLLDDTHELVEGRPLAHRALYN